MTNTLVITAFNRPALIRDCLESCSSLDGIDQYKIVMVHQKGNSDVERIISDYSHFFSTLISTEPSGRNTDTFITNNRILGLYVGFEFWKSEFVVSVEEDVILAPDSLRFIEFAFEKNKSDSNFRGVNLGSKLPLLEVGPFSYSRLRFGMHGPASMITKETWKKINPQRIMKNSSIIFDAQVEFALKTGFMITPNASRYIDQGVVGSHTTDKLDDHYFNGLKGSFVGDLKTSNDYFLENFQPNWRQDCVVYKVQDNLKYEAKNKCYWILLKFPKILHFLNRNNR